ncbi:MAG TPA: hypothetical protein VF817_02260 [Patescibacteria group bacterium]
MERTTVSFFDSYIEIGPFTFKIIFYSAIVLVAILTITVLWNQLKSRESDKYITGEEE